MPQDWNIMYFYYICGYFWLGSVLHAIQSTFFKDMSAYLSL